ncbi:MAG: DNA mismatch repair endonuclease MutL [Thermodesulfobacteriota bacterium]|nr:DNA mismatch repair endonuclease MutL [Thermodesulfobacteriota bacterium]
MAAIKILPEVLSNKIAAGEVVERPASVVKELVENAIDAQSTAITVDIKNGGRSLIQVSDDGAGMSRDDALLCLERYATSKLQDEESLFAISTLGFRGEALPSIASVSRVTLTTRLHEADEATEITVSGGTIKNVKTAGAPPGTLIEVADLFFNTPARRKFLKSANTEMGHITDIVDAVAMCRHDIHFKLTHNNKSLRNLVRTAAPFDRAAALLGREVRPYLHPVEYADDRISISGWISSPAITRSTSQKIHLFVNGRAIKDRGLQYALFEGYRGRLVKGSFPVAALFLAIPYDRVDVNVHPTKNEVRFADQRQVYEALKTAVSNTWAGETRPPWEHGPETDGPETDRAETDSTGVPADRLSGEAARNQGVPAEVAERMAEYPRMRDVMLPKADEVKPSVNEALFSQPITGEPPPALDSDPSPAETVETASPAGGKGFFSGLSVVGQFQQTYIVCESPEGVVFIDQHAAHERIVFETLKRRQRDGRPASQGLLVPETVELGHTAAAALSPLLPEFLQFGLEMEDFGQNTFAVKAVPAVVADADITPMIREMGEKLSESGFAPDTDTLLDTFLIIMACHGAIRANRRLSEQEMRTLLVQLDACENPWHCPHGRPTSVNWGMRTIEKAFKRIV